MLYLAFYVTVPSSTTCQDVQKAIQTDAKFKFQYSTLVGAGSQAVQEGALAPALKSENYVIVSCLQTR